MRRLITLLLLFSLPGFAAIDFGVGNSSFTGGRASPALALGMNTDSWGLLYRSVGVQSSIYAQNAWTFAAYRTAYSEKFGPVNSYIGAGIGATYILRTFRAQPTDKVESTSEHVLGPHLILKFELGPVFLSFDTLLGLTRQLIQHIVLNFQDVSQVTIGFTF